MKKIRGLQAAPVSVVTFIHGNSKIISEWLLKRKKNLHESMSGCGNMDEFWDMRDFRLGTTVLVVDVHVPKVHPQSQAWIFSVTAPVNCPVRYYLLNIYCLFPVHVWRGSQEI